MRAAVTLMLVCVGTMFTAAWTRPWTDQITRGAEAAVAADAVQLQVSVREGSRTVSGLTAADFVLTDNDVAQTVQAVSVDLPADVTLVIDTKGSTTSVAERLASDLQQIARLLRKDDALRLIRLDTFVEELRPIASIAGPLPAASAWRVNGLSSLHDGLIAALVRPNALGRRQLVVCITDGIDTLSVSTADRVREIASRSDAVMQIVAVRPAASSGVTASLRPRYRDANALILTEAAEQTGGELRAPALFGDTDLVAAFTRVFEDFRQSYAIRYTPASVEHAGWHEISVTVPRARNAVVRARRGYHAN